MLQTLDNNTNTNNTNESSQEWFRVYVNDDFTEYKEFDAYEQVLAQIDRMTGINEIRCERFININMTQVLVNTLKGVQDPSDPLSELGLNEAIDELSKYPTIFHLASEAFLCIKSEPKRREFEAIDLFEAHRLQARLKGKKNPPMKKNTASQLFETFEEATESFDQTMANFDYFLEPIIPTMMDIEYIIPDYNIPYPLNRTCFLLPCAREELYPGAILPKLPPQQRSTYQKMATKKRNCKIPTHFNWAYINGVIRVCMFEYNIWLTGSWGTIGN